MSEFLEHLFYARPLLFTVSIVLVGLAGKNVSERTHLCVEWDTSKNLAPYRALLVCLYSIAERTRRAQQLVDCISSDTIKVCASVSSLPLLCTSWLVQLFAFAFLSFL